MVLKVRKICYAHTYSGFLKKLCADKKIKDKKLSSESVMTSQVCKLEITHLVCTYVCMYIYL